MSICPHCGAENAEQARFCSACGEALTPPPRAAAEVRKTVTVVFCDVANSTRLGERLDPEAHRMVMGRYFESMRIVLERHGGTVEKFIGDAVMALFGVPVVHEDDALRAVRAATEMREALAELNRELRRNWDLEIAMRIGVNTGEVVTGEPGAAQTLVTGDAVVVAKRLEETASANEIQLGADTRRLVKDAVLAEPAGLLEAKGKPAIDAWRLLAVLSGAEVTPLRLDSPLVGRELDLEALEATYERAVADRTCHLFAVLGTAGIGKSRLTHEFIERVNKRALVLRGRCLPYGDGITFWPLVELVKQAARLTDTDSPADARAKIAALLPSTDDAGLICDRIAAAVGRGEAPGGRPEETFWAVRRLLESLANQRPVVVVLDDLQWAESTFLDLVEYLVGSSTGSPILICCLARPELIELRPSWAVPRSRSIAALLEPLDQESTEEMMRNLLGAAPLPGDVRERVAEAAQGNPLFVEEMLRMLRDEGLLQRQNGGWQLTGDLSGVAIPPTIHALLAARLDRLAPEERALVQRASVAGQVFWWGALAELSPEPARASVGAHLQSLVRKELIGREPSAFTAEDAFRFRHILVRDAAYAALPKELRAELHERLAGWLSAKVGERAAEYEEIVAYHLEQAFLYRRELGHPGELGRELASRAAERLASAGRRALARGDVAASANLLGRAAAILADDNPMRVELLPELGVALRETGDLVSANRVLREALSGAERSSDRITEHSARIELASLYLLSDPGGSETDRLLTQVEEAIPLLETMGEDRLLSRAWSLIALARGLWKGRLARGEEALERALRHARAANDRRQEAIILGQLAFSAWSGPTPVPAAVDRCERILDLAGGDQLIEAGVRRYLASLQARRGRFEEARELIARATEGYDDLGIRLTAEAARAFASGDVEILAGDYDAAERALRPALEALEEMGERGYLSSVGAFLSAALYGQGRLEEAADAARTAEEGAAKDDVWSQAVARGTRAKVLARQGACAEAETLAREAVALVSETDALELHGSALLDLAEVLRICGFAEEAHAHVERALRTFEQKQSSVLAGRARSLLESGGPAVVTALEGRADQER